MSYRVNYYHGTIYRGRIVYKNQKKAPPTRSREMCPQKTTRIFFPAPSFNVCFVDYNWYHRYNYGEFAPSEHTADPIAESNTSTAAHSSTQQQHSCSNSRNRSGDGGGTGLSSLGYKPQISTFRFLNGPVAYRWCHAARFRGRCMHSSQFHS